MCAPLQRFAHPPNGWFYRFMVRIKQQLVEGMTYRKVGVPVISAAMLSSYVCRYFRHRGLPSSNSGNQVALAGTRAIAKVPKNIASSAGSTATAT